MKSAARAAVGLGLLGGAWGFVAPASGPATLSVPRLRQTGAAGMSMAADRPKIVITGVGSVTSVGWGSKEHFDKLLAGESGLQRLPEWADEYPAQVGCLVDPSFPVNDYMDKRDTRRQGRYTHLAMAAAKMAVSDAKLDPTAVESDKFGVIIGSGIGGVEWFEENCLKYNNVGGGGAGLKKVSPFLIPALIGDTASGIVAIEFKARGPNFGVTSACATGSHAIGTALDFMLRGEADIMLAGGSEAAMTPLCFAGFAAMKAMVTTFNDNPKAASRPFDKDRSGFVMGEGSGVILMETEEHAKARGAEIYCEVAGYGATCDANHITAPLPDGSGLGKAMQMAMRHGGMTADEMAGATYINAHGTSTPYNDKFETMAIKYALGDAAYKTYISSTKSMMGHTLGAAGGLEAAICAQVLKHQQIPPTLNCDEPDLEAGCDLNYCAHTKVVPTEKIKYAMSNNLGFGGHNACLAFKAYEG